MASLFTSETPAGTDNSDGTPGITTATTVRFTADGQVAGIRFYATTTVSGAYTAALYEVTDAAEGGAGDLLASEVAGVAPTGGTWNTVTFDTPVPVTTGVLYRACIHSDAGRYVNTSAFFVSPLVNGDIVADSNGDSSAGFGVLAQGTFEINAALGFPNDTFSASCYFVDVDFTADGAGVAVVGRCVAVATTTATAQKVAPATGVTVAAPTTQAAAVHVAPVSGRTVGAATAHAVAVHRTPVVATTTAVATSTAETVKRAGVTATTAAVAITTAAVVKRVAVSGTTVAVATSTAAVAQPGGPVAVVARCVGVALCRARTRGITRRPNTGTTTRPFTGITYWS